MYRFETVDAVYISISLIFLHLSLKHWMQVTAHDYFSILKKKTKKTSVFITDMRATFVVCNVIIDIYVNIISKSKSDNEK